MKVDDVICTFTGRDVVLRAATLSVNAQNTPHYRKSSVGYRGVSARGKRFFAHIVKNDKQINLGFFDCEIEAARAYDDAARSLYGGHAVVNFPEEEGAQ